VLHPRGPSRRSVPVLTHDHASLFQPPEAIGPYRVRRVLASGTLGPRLLVEDGRGRLQVLKLITDLDGDAAALAERLEAMRQVLPSPLGLLPVTEIGISDEGVYLASPVLDAPTIEARLRGGRQTLEATLPWLRPVVAGLQAAHDAGVHHGAIHPRDVLVADDGGVLTGVGIAPALEAVGAQAPVRVPFTAPERASGRAWDARADQYSLAMLALDALSGRRLIAGTIPAFDRWTLAETPAEDARLHDVFVRALDPDPEQRYETLAEWVEALAGFHHVAEEGELSRFAREGVILSPAAAAAAEVPHDIDVQSLEDVEGVALSPFPEEDGDSTVVAPVASTHGDEPSTMTVPVDGPIEEDEPDQEWLVAAVPDHASTGDDDDAFGHLPPGPAIDPAPIGRGSAAAAGAAGWSLDDLDRPARPAIATPSLGPSWDEPAASDDSRRGLWLVLVVLLVLAGVGYGTWRSLQGPASGPVSGTSASREATDAAPPATSDPVPQAPRPPRGSTSGNAVTPAPVPPAVRPPPAPASAATPASSAPAPPPAPAVGLGRALIRSSPSGEVQVNGRARGQTPVVLRDLPYGNYVVTVTRPGFETAQRELELMPSQPVASLTIDLVRSGTPDQNARAGEARSPATSSSPAADAPARPAPAMSGPASGLGEGGAVSGPTGGVLVLSTPAQSRFSVDGRAYGSTPGSVAGLSAGPHVIRVERAGYRPWEGRIDVTPGMRVRVQATLQQEPE